MRTRRLALVLALYEIIRDNMDALVSVGRIVRGAYRHGTHRGDSGSTHAMYVKSRDETWMCFVAPRDDGTASARLAVCKGRVVHMPGVLDGTITVPFVRDAVVLPAANLVRLPVDLLGDAAAINACDGYVPGQLLGAAMRVGRSCAMYGRWHTASACSPERVDAMYVLDTDHTWCCVQHGGTTRLLVLRGYHLLALEQVHRDGEAEAVAAMSM